MLKTSIGLVFLALLFASDSLAQSQGPAPGSPQAQGSSQGKAERDQQKAADGQTPSNESPVVTLRILGPKSDAANGANQNAGSSKRDSTDWWMFGATVGIGLIGLLQLVAFIVQACYLAKSAEEMQNTTRAAKDVSADQITHAHQVERAYISGGGAPEMEILKYADSDLLDKMKGGIFKSPDSTRIWTGLFVLAINNYGKTPGELDRVEIGFCEADSIPDTPTPETRINFHDWIGPGTASRPIHKFPIPSKVRPAVYGRFYYRDIFGRRHSSGFINEVDREGRSVPLLAPVAYTEERDEP